MALRTRPTQFPDLAAAVADRADHRGPPPGQLPDRLRGPAQQGDRRRQRVRPRVRHPPGRRHQEPADLRDHDPAVRRADRQPADDRQAVRPARAPGQAQGARLRAGGRGARRDLPRRRSPSPTRRRKSPTPTCSRSSSSATSEVPASVALLGWSVSSSSRRERHGHRLARGHRRGKGAATPPATARSMPCSGPWTRPSSPVLGWRPDPHRVRDQGRVRRRGRPGPGPGPLPPLVGRGPGGARRVRATACPRTSSRPRSRRTSWRSTSSTAPRSTASRWRSSAGARLRISRDGRISRGGHGHEPGDPALTYRIALIPGDGVGPEVIAGAVASSDARAGGSGSASTGPSSSSAGPRSTPTASPSDPRTWRSAATADAILLGAVGGPKWSDPSATVRPEQALFALRGGLGLFANLRPVTVHPSLIAASPLARSCSTAWTAHRPRADRRALLRRPSEPRTTPDGERAAIDTLPYTEREIRRIVTLAFELARGRRRQADPVDKANVLATSRLWRTVAEEVARGLPGRHARPPARGLRARCCSSAGPRLRRHRHREPVRRHPVGRGGGAGRLARDAAVGVARDAADGPRHASGCTSRSTAPRRTSPARTSANPIGHDPVGGDAAALVAGSRRRGGRHRGGRQRRPGRRLADRRPRPMPRRQPAPWSGQEMAHDRGPVRDLTAGDRHRRRGIGHTRRDDDPSGTRMDPSGMSDQPGHPLRHDPARRHAGREHHAVARGQAARRPDARRVRHAVHRGRLARLQPQGHRVLRRGPARCAGKRAKLAAFGSHAPPLEQAAATTRTCASSSPPRRPVVTIFGKSWLLHVIEVLGATPAENLDMIADSVGFVVDRGREAVYDAEHFFDGYKADRDYALADAAGRARQAGARTLVLCDTNGGTPDRRAGARSSATSGARSRATRTRRPSPGASTPTTTPSWRSPTRWPRSRPASATSRRRSTATASAAATPTWSRSWPTSRSRRRTSWCPAGGGRPRRPDRAVALRRRDRQRQPQRLPAVRRPVGVRPQGRRPRRRGGQGRAQLPARGPDGRRQRRPPRRLGARRPGQHRDPRPSSWATSSRASWTRASSAG